MSRQLPGGPIVGVVAEVIVGAIAGEIVGPTAVRLRVCAGESSARSVYNSGFFRTTPGKRLQVDILECFFVNYSYDKRIRVLPTRGVAYPFCFFEPPMYS